MKTIRALTLALVALAVAWPAAAQQPKRLYDTDVKSLIEQSRSTFDRFWNSLDEQFRNSTFKDATGEAIVKNIGGDYKKALEVLGQRFSSSYAAAMEVDKVSAEAVRIHRYVERQGPNMKGAAEWRAHAELLRQLAAEYGGTFPPADNQKFHRYTDSEVVAAATAVEASMKSMATAIDNALKKDKATAEAARKGLVADVKRVGEAAKSLASALKGRKPAAAQVTALLDQTKKVRGAVTASAAAGAVEAQWTRVDDSLKTITGGFHLQ